MDAPIDKAEALEMLGGDESCYEEVVRLFVDEAQRRVATIEAALQAGDHHGVERMAHGLKGSAASLAAEAVRRAAEEVEQMARDVAASAKLAALRDRVAELAAFVRRTS